MPKNVENAELIYMSPRSSQRQTSLGGLNADMGADVQAGPEKGAVARYTCVEGFLMLINTTNGKCRT